MGRTRKTTNRGLAAHDSLPDVQTRVDGLRLDHASADPLSAAAPPGFETEFDAPDTDFDAPDSQEVTRHRDPRLGGAHRLSLTLRKILKRKREEIGLQLPQLARLTGLSLDELELIESSGPYRLAYDHVVVLARALGLPPEELPGLRAREEPTTGSHVETLHRALEVGTVLTFEGAAGERFGGPIERVGVVPGFAVRVGDASLGESYPAGTLLAFVSDGAPRPGEVALVRHRKHKQLLLRRLQPPRWAGLAAWQPAQPAGTGSDWVPQARLVLALHRLP